MIQHTRRRFIQLSLAGMGALALPWKLFPAPVPPSPTIITSEVLRKVVRLMKAYEIPTFPDGYWHVTWHPDTEYDVLNDKTIVTVFQKEWQLKFNAVVGNDNPLLKGTVPEIYGFKFYRNSDVPIGTLSHGRTEILHLRYNNAIWLMHRATLARHPKTDVYNTVFFGPGSEWENWPHWVDDRVKPGREATPLRGTLTL